MEEILDTVALQWDHTRDLADEDQATHYVQLPGLLWPSVFSLASTLLLDCFQEGSTIFRVTAQNSVGDRDPLDSKQPFIIAKEKGNSSVFLSLSHALYSDLFMSAVCFQESINSLQGKEYALPQSHVKLTFLLPLKD